ncbi:MAG: 2-amino-4-hydroxy-6-hydroxymethyldihydropteridine diphosphokinase [Acidiferrobacterales bacterium]
MPRVFVSIGSNIDRDKNVRTAVKLLDALYRPLALSTVYESGAIGFDGHNFYNLVAGFDTDHPIEEVAKRLVRIEHECGRERGGRAPESRTLDLDLLLYGHLCQHGEDFDVPRPEIRQYAFVLKPLAEIAARYKHPETGTTIGEMWRTFNHREQALWPVAFDFGLGG